MVPNHCRGNPARPCPLSREKWGCLMRTSEFFPPPPKLRYSFVPSCLPFSVLKEWWWFTSPREALLYPTYPNHPQSLSMLLRWSFFLPSVPFLQVKKILSSLPLVLSLVLNILPHFSPNYFLVTGLIGFFSLWLLSCPSSSTPFPTL